MVKRLEADLGIQLLCGEKKKDKAVVTATRTQIRCYVEPIFAAAQGFELIRLPRPVSTCPSDCTIPACREGLACQGTLISLKCREAPQTATGSLQPACPCSGCNHPSLPMCLCMPH